ncbi:MAG: cyclopropane fatty acyl phospholipid synthase [Desulfobacterales bacterium]
MNYNRLKNHVVELLGATGITVNGKNPWDIQVNHEDFYRRVLTHGSLGLGESYMENWWECDQLDDFFYRVLRHDIEREVKKNPALIMDILLSRTINRQSRRRAFQVGERHYDLGNDLFRGMLDRRMAYSCGYWKDAVSLDEAQEKKLDLVCRKLGLKAGMKLLDIGCGWGSFAKYAAETYPVEVIGITVSKEQAEFGKTMSRSLPVDIKLQDYRSISGKFDRVVSIGMFEHVGYKNYADFMKIVHKHLTDDGLFLLHTIGGNASVTSVNPWMNKYIFPNGMLPSMKQIGKAAEGLFVMEDWHNFGADYDKTLMAWHRNFEHIKSAYDDRFYKMWKYFLLSCAGAFRARNIQLWQIVFSKKGLVGGYTSIR